MSWLDRSLYLGVSKLWSSVNQARRWARDHGGLEGNKLPIRTIGVGNLQAGGTGKTPLVIQIAREAVGRGLLVAVLTRGYRSAWESTGGIIPPTMREPSPVLCGDEAALVRNQVPEIWIGVGADRFKQFEAMQAQALEVAGRPFDLVILDDAFQHFRILCDQYVVAVTDAEEGSRFFRDSFSALRTEDLVILTKGEEYPAELSSHPRKLRISLQVPAPAPGRKYRFIAALGDPERARQSLTSAGYAIEEMDAFPDHHPFDAAEAAKILAEAKARGETVLLTGKDWVKWRALGISPSSVEVIEPKIEIHGGRSLWDAVLWEPALK